MVVKLERMECYNKEDIIMSDYITRMKEEHKGLRAKLHALNGFIAGKVFSTIPGKKQKLLKKQLRYMNSYSETLGERIELELNP